MHIVYLCVSDAFAFASLWRHRFSNLVVLSDPACHLSYKHPHFLLEHVTENAPCRQVSEDSALSGRICLYFPPTVWSSSAGSLRSLSDSLHPRLMQH